MSDSYLNRNPNSIAVAARWSAVFALAVLCDRIWLRIPEDSPLKWALIAVPPLVLSGAALVRQRIRTARQRQRAALNAYAEREIARDGQSYSSPREEASYRIHTDDRIKADGSPRRSKAASARKIAKSVESV